MFKKIIFLILIIFAFKGCTRDDICPDGTAVTPNLVVVFKDFANPINDKKVTFLTVLTDNSDSIAIVNIESTDSILIPLNTNSDTSRYLFKRTIFNGTDTISRNFDKLTFIYTRKNGYVNRACGFKTEFYDLDFDLENQGTENWIKQVTINRDTVNDENSAHVTILH